jgi:hypothetical protein
MTMLTNASGAPWGGTRNRRFVTFCVSTAGNFIGEDVGNDFASGLSALETNWRGLLLTNQKR